MAQTAANVLAAKPKATGGVLMGDLGSTLPTDATTELDAAFRSGGYVGEDGLTEAGERDTERIKAWGGDTVRVLQTEHTLTYSFTFLESLNADVLAAVYGDGNVTTTAASASAGTLHAVKINGDVLPHKAFIFEMKDGDAKIRIAVPDGQITEVGEITYTDGEVIGYEVTVECFMDPATQMKAVKYLDDGKPSAA